MIRENTLTSVNGLNQNGPNIKKKKSRVIFKMIKRNIGAWVLLIPCLICFVLFVWRPLISGLYLSFFETRGYDAVKFIGFDNYISVMGNPEFRAALLNSLSYTFWSLLIGFILPIFVAILLNEMVHLNSFFKVAIYFPSIVPSVAAAVLWYYIFLPGNSGILNILLQTVHLPTSQWLQNSQLTIPLIVFAMTWKGFGGTTLIYLASLQGINHELYEAASLDGANLWHKIRKIILPEISGTVMLMFIMQIIGVFQTMNEPLTMTDGGPNNASISLMLESYFYAFRYFQAGKSMAVGAITFVILSVLTIIYQILSRRFQNDD